jgi:Ca2+:H+ antiporter
MAGPPSRGRLDRWLIGVSLILTLTTVGLRLLHAHHVAVFALACVSLLPIASLMGKATEELAKYAGSTVGGLLNATFGNATELIVAAFALQAGLIDVVKASITGSIISNILVVLGFSALIGGLKRERQTFSAVAATTHASMLVVAVVSLLVPAIFVHATPAEVAHDPTVLRLGLWVAVVLISVYGAGLLFSLKTHRDVFEGDVEQGQPEWSRRWSVGVLVGSTLLVALLSEVLVKALEPILEGGRLSPLFVGVIILPFVGNAAEHAGAVMMATRDKMDIALGIAVGSSTQIALFVAPVLVFLSWAMGHPMTYIFEVSEIVAIAASVAVVNFISYDGSTNWLEGVQLLGAYAIMALTFFFIG